jgi:hypothetical protein
VTTKLEELRLLSEENRVLRHRTSVLQRAVEGSEEQARGPPAPGRHGDEGAPARVPPAALRGRVGGRSGRGRAVRLEAGAGRFRPSLRRASPFACQPRAAARSQ